VAVKEALFLKLSDNGKAIAFLGAAFLLLAYLCLNSGKNSLGVCCIIVVAGCALMLYASHGGKQNGRRK
jgi:VIT1/CCC1 family predicted Fe2+/Mn2+ transporter